MKCHICNTDNNLQDCKHYECLNRDGNDKKEFLINQSIAEVKQMIFNQQEFNIARGFKCDYQIAEIIN